MKKAPREGRPMTERYHKMLRRNGSRLTIYWTTTVAGN
jgi:hypothetical protein